METAESASRRCTRISRSRVFFTAGFFCLGLTCLGWGLADGAARGESVAESFNLAEPARGVFVHSGRALPLDALGHDDIANIGFIVGDRCVAVIDTGGSVRIGRALRGAIAQHTSLPVCYVINTHVHVDHVLGNYAFKDEKPSFVGHASLADAISRNREFFLSQYAADLAQPPSAGQVISPDRLVERGLVLDLGNRPLTLRAWRKSHSDSDLSIYDERTGTLWTGDLLFRERLPALDGNIKGWLSTLDELASLKVKLAVPGHGTISRDLRGAIRPERRYLEALISGVRDELAQGKSLDDAIQHVAAAEKPHWLLWESAHPHNVAQVYEELSWE